MRASDVRVAARTHVFTESVIREMTRLALEHGAMNLAQGFPDFPAPDFVKEAAIRAIREDVNQYAITWGSPRLRRAVAAKTARHYGLEYDPESEITVTCGATEAMMATMLALIEPGDEVIVFEPFYENYVPDAAMCGAAPVFVPLRPPEYRFDPAELRRAVTPRTRAIVLNTPNNPCGRVFTRTELEVIASVATEAGALVITDEIYEHIVFDGRRHVPIATLPDMRERTVIVSGISKTFSVTGWRIGYVLAPAPLSAAIRKVHDFLTVGAPAPLQEAAAVAIEVAEERGYYDELRTFYQAHRDLLVDGLRRAGFRATVPEGAYYVMADFSGLRFEGDDVAFARYLTEWVGVAPVPGSSFYRHQDLGRTSVRFTFSKSRETLEEAIRRLTAAFG